MISPRMDFEQWTPLGRGDPLKNDPTFDYLPPVLDKVHYWKPSPSAAAVNRAAHYASTAPTAHAVQYNRRFFLTDFSKKEPAAGAYVQYTHKRPSQPHVVAAGGATGYHYPRPKTPLPMLTPPPYQRPVPSTTVEPMDMTPFLLDAGDSAAESKQPPAVRAPPPPPPPPPPTRLQSSAAAVAAAASTETRPVLSHSVIKVLLDAEVDRTTVTRMTTTTTAAIPMSWTTTTPMAWTTSTPMTWTTTTPATRTTTTPATRTTAVVGPVFAAAPQRKQPAATDRPPMYLIIQGHSKVKTYGLASKPDDLQSASQSAAQDHNHLGNDPDEPSRRKRNGPLR